MLRNSISVDMTVYALQLKQKFTAGISHELLRNFRITTLGAASEKKTVEEKGAQ